MKWIIALAMLPSVAFAQQASIAQTAPPPPVELTFKVTPDEINLISEGLQEMSIRRAMPLIAKLRQQIADQQPKPVAPEAPK